MSAEVGHAPLQCTGTTAQRVPAGARSNHFTSNTIFLSSEGETAASCRKDSREVGCCRLVVDRAAIKKLNITKTEWDGLFVDSRVFTRTTQIKIGNAAHVCDTL